MSSSTISFQFISLPIYVFFLDLFVVCTKERENPFSPDISFVFLFDDITELSVTNVYLLFYALWHVKTLLTHRCCCFYCCCRCGKAQQALKPKPSVLLCVRCTRYNSFIYFPCFSLVKCVCLCLSFFRFHFN